MASLRQISKILFLTLSFINLHSFNRSYFYRTSAFYGEPRFEKPWLSTWDTELSFGKEKHDFFKLWELDFNYYQNFAYGLFTHFHLPAVFVLDQKICSDICLPFKKELTPCENESGLADTTLFLGWTLNHQKTNHLDFVDFTVKSGVLFPTSKSSNHKLLGLPLGYNGHWGIPWSVDLSIGYCDWLTFGLHADGVGFINREIKNAIVKAGPVSRAGIYSKMDHICFGVSLLLGFTYEQKNRDKITPHKENRQIEHCLDTVQCSTWSRSVFHLFLEWDLANECRRLAPRVGFSYNVQMHGKRVFKTNMIDGWLGLDVDWCF